MKKAIYHNAEGFKPVEVSVLRENKDGTLDLANEEGELVIGKCTIGTAEGQCTLIEDKAAKPVKPTEPEKPAKPTK